MLDFEACAYLVKVKSPALNNNSTAWTLPIR